MTTGDTDPTDVAEKIAAALRDSEGQVERERCETKQRLEQTRRTVLAKLDRGYDDYVSGRISEEFWTRRSEQWRRSADSWTATWFACNTEMDT
jgi:hypothetical protein